VAAAHHNREADREQLEEDHLQERTAQAGLETRSEAVAEGPAGAGRASDSHQSHAEGARTEQDSPCSLAVGTEAGEHHEVEDSHIPRSERPEGGSESPDRPYSHEEEGGSLCCRYGQSTEVHRDGY
jgi:hypothetical protein